MAHSLRITSSGDCFSGDREPLPNMDLSIHLQSHNMRRLGWRQGLTPCEGRRLKLMDLRVLKALPGRLLPGFCVLPSGPPSPLPAGAAGLPLAESCSHRQELGAPSCAQPPQTPLSRARAEAADVAALLNGCVKHAALAVQHLFATAVLS